MSFLYSSDQPVQQTITPFNDTETVCYKASLAPSFDCNLSLVYTLSSNGYGVVLVPGSPNIIQVLTKDHTIKGTSIDITLTANAVPPLATPPAKVTFTVTIEDPCPAATLAFSAQPEDMNYLIKSPEVTQNFVPEDSVSTLVKIEKVCGEYSYSVEPDLPFLRLEQTGQIIVSSTDLQHAGSYELTVSFGLRNYPGVKLATAAKFKILVAPGMRVDAPYFKPKLDQNLLVYMSNTTASWSYRLPPIYDPNDDPDSVTISANFREASRFMKLNGKESIEIEDISSAGAIKPGHYFISLKLNDRRDQVSVTQTQFPVFDMLLLVFPPWNTTANNQTESTEPSLNSTLNNLTEFLETLNATNATENQTAGWQLNLTKANETQDEQIPRIILEPQRVEPVPPKIVQEFMEKLSINGWQQQFKKRTEDIKDAVESESCIPVKSVAIPVESTALIDLNFLHLVSLQRTNELVQEMKRTGSIQLQLFKADPSIPESPFEWDIFADTDHSIKLSVNFTNPDSISPSTLGDDHLRVLFKDASKFISCPLLSYQTGRKLNAMPKDVEVVIKLPALYATAATEAFEDAVEVMDSAGGRTTIVSSVVANYMIGMSVNLLWGGINSLQLVSVLALYNVIVPPNSKSLMKFVQTLVTFDMLYDIYDPNDHLPFSTTPAFSDNFCSVKYCTLGYFDALGSVFVILVIQAAIWVIVPLIRAVAARIKCIGWKCCKSARQRTWPFTQDAASVTNAIIRTTLENYTTYLTSGFISMYARGKILEIYGKANIYDRVNYWSGYLTLGFTGVFTLVVFYAIAIEFKRQKKSESIQRSLINKQNVIRMIESHLVELSEAEKKKSNQVSVNSRPVSAQEPGELERQQSSRQPDLQQPDSADQEEEEKQADASHGGHWELDSNLEDQSSDPEISPEPAKEQSIGEWTRYMKRELRRLDFETFKDDGDQQSLTELVNRSLNMVGRNQSQKNRNINGRRIDREEDSEDPFGRAIINQKQDQEPAKAEEEAPSSIQQDDAADLNSELRVESQLPEQESGPIDFILNTEEEKEATKNAVDNILVEQFLASLEEERDLPQLKELLGRSNASQANIAKYLEILRKKRLDLLKQEQAHCMMEASSSWFNLKYFSTLQEDMEPRVSSLYFHILFIVRRIIVVGIVFVLPERNFLQLITFGMTGLFTVVYQAGARPFYWRSQDKTELFNEFIILLIADTYLALLANVYDVKSLVNIGHFLNFWVVLLFFGNIGVMFVIQSSTILNKIKVYWAKAQRRCRRKAPKSQQQPEQSHHSPKVDKVESESSEPSQADISNRQLLRSDPSGDVALMPALRNQLKNEEVKKTEKQMFNQKLVFAIEKLKSDISKPVSFGLERQGK